MSDLGAQFGKSLSRVRLNSTDKLSLLCIQYIVLYVSEVLCEGKLVIKDT